MALRAVWAHLREVLTPPPLPPCEANRYASSDAWEAISAVYQEHLLLRGKKVPRWTKWLFVIIVPIIVALVAVGMRQVLQSLNHLVLRSVFEHVDRRFADKSGAALFACVGCMLLLNVTLLSCSIVISRVGGQETTGRGMPAVVGHLNGIVMPRWGAWHLLVVKVVTTILTIAAMVPLGHFGILGEIGAMMGSAFLTRNLVTLRIPFLKHFRNPRDTRLIVNIGLAAGITAAFQSPMGGLLVLLELLTSRFPVKFAAYVFTGCVICAFTVQVMATYFDGFEIRQRDPGTPTAQLDPTSEQVQVELNYALLLPTLVIAFACGLVGSLFVMLTRWTSRITHSPEVPRAPIRTVILTLCVGMAYTTINVFGAFGFGGKNCTVPQPSAIEIDALRVAYANYTHTVSLGTTTNLFCSNKSGSALYGAEENTPINTYASLALTFPESAFRLLIQREVSLEPAAISAFLPILFLGACFFAAQVRILNGDTILPCAMLGGCIGQLVYHAQLHVPQVDAAWVNSGVYSLIGAAALLASVNHLTFSLVFLMVDVSGDVRHILFVMIAVAIARSVSKHIFKLDSLEHSILRTIGCPLLDFADNIATRDDFSLHNFQTTEGTLRIVRARDSVRYLWSLISETTHNAFPVVAPDGHSFIGVIHRRTIELLLWRLTKVPPQRLRVRVEHTASSRNLTLDRSSRWVPPHLAQRELGTTLAHESITQPLLTASVDVTQSTNYRQMMSQLPSGIKENLKDGEDEYSLLRDLDDWIELQRMTGTYYPLLPSTELSSGRGSEAFSRHAIQFPTLDAALDDMDARNLTQVVNIARYADRSPFVVRSESSAGRAYQMFNVLGVRHLIIVDYRGQPRGILTRIDLLRQVFETKRKEEAAAKKEEDAKRHVQGSPRVGRTDSDTSTTTDEGGSGSPNVVEVMSPSPTDQNAPKARRQFGGSQRVRNRPRAFDVDDTVFVSHVETRWGENAFTSMRAKGDQQHRSSPGGQNLSRTLLDDRHSTPPKTPASIVVTERQALFIPPSSTSQRTRRRAHSVKSPLRPRVPPRAASANFDTPSASRLASDRFLLSDPFMRPGLTSMAGAPSLDGDTSPPPRAPPISPAGLPAAPQFPSPPSTSTLIPEPFSPIPEQQRRDEVLTAKDEPDDDPRAVGTEPRQLSLPRGLPPAGPAAAGSGGNGGAVSSDRMSISRRTTSRRGSRRGSMSGSGASMGSPHDDDVPLQPIVTPLSEANLAHGGGDRSESEAEGRTPRQLGRTVTMPSQRRDGDSRAAATASHGGAQHDHSAMTEP
jgi:chloride channel 7